MADCDRGTDVVYVYVVRPATIIDLPYLAEIERSAGTLFRTVGLDAIADDEPMAVDDLKVMVAQGLVWVAVAVASHDVDHAVDAGHDRTGKGVDLCGIDDGGGGGGDGVGVDIDRTTDKTGSVREGVEEPVGFLAAFAFDAAGPVAISPPSTMPVADQHYSTGPSSSSVVPRDQALCEVFLHIAELSVHASHQRKGVARALLSELVLYAEAVNQGWTMPHVGDITTTTIPANTSATGPSIAAGPNTGADVLPETKSGMITIKALTLTTYLDIAFNGPFYAKTGFEVIGDDGDEIERVFGLMAREIWDTEQREIAIKAGRGWMVRWLRD